MINRLVITLLLSLFTLLGIASQVQVQVESRSIIAGKPFTITFRIDDPSQRMTPDFSPLEKVFNILSTATSTRITVINGQRQAEIVWSVILQADKVGKMTIPSIDFGSLRSPETPITVEKRAQAVSKPLNADQQQASVFLKAEVSNKKPYINEAVIYTVNLYRQRGVFINGSYQQQEVDNALVVPLNKSQDSTILSNGRAFLVESMSYAIYPNDKGILNIKPPSLRGTISDIYMRRFDIDANEVKLDVQPIPKSAQNYWLPASKVTLTQDISQDTNQLKQGDTVVRTIKLTANGLPAQLIPEFKLPPIKQAKIYEEKPERDNTAINNQVVGTLSLQATYLLEKPGFIELPEVKVRWFNTQTRQFEIATLPKQTWQVEATASGATNQPDTPISTSENVPASKSEPNKKSNKINHINSGWLIFAILAGTLLIIVTIIRFLTNRQKENSVSVVLRANERVLKQELKSACQKNDAAEAKKALIKWAVFYFDNPNIINLSQVSNQVGHRGLSKAIQGLNQSLYSPKQEHLWRGDVLFQAWEDYHNKRKKNKHKNSQSLSPMFPET